MTTVTHHRLGRVEYADGLELMRQFQEARRANLVNDTLLTLEHPPVLTMGRGAKPLNIIAPKAVLDGLGVAVFETDRGGDVTYHGPGQLVGYPLLHLPPGRQDVRKYVRDIEETIIRTLADFEIEGTRFEQWPGVWLASSRAGGPRKICAIGVHLSRWYTRHGFALNVAPSLSHFELIVPCGIKEAGVTSMAVELGHPVSFAGVETRIAFHFGEVFEASIEEPATESTRTVAVALIDEHSRVLLLKRTDARGGFWQIVTGHLEHAESPLDAARRELREETGLSLEPTSLEYVHSFARQHEAKPRLATETGYFVRVPNEKRRTIERSAEHSELEWVSAKVALERLPFEGLREVVRRALRA